MDLVGSFVNKTQTTKIGGVWSSVKSFFPRENMFIVEIKHFISVIEETRNAPAVHFRL